MRMLSYTARVRSMRTWLCRSVVKPRVVPPRTQTENLFRSRLYSTNYYYYYYYY